MGTGNVSLWEPKENICIGAFMSWVEPQKAFTFSGHIPTESCSRAGVIESGLYSLSPEGKITKLPLSSIGHYGEHSWSPNGLQISYPCWREEISSKRPESLCIQSANQTDPRFLLPLEKTVQFPNWSPNGNEIVFEIYESDHYDLAKVNLDTANVIELTQHLGGKNRWPKWSPDGSEIAFLHSDGNHQNLWIMNADGSNPRPIFDLDFIENGFGVSGFGWSPSGSKLVFSSSHEGACRETRLLDATLESCETKIYIFDLADSEITDVFDYDLNPLWDIFWLDFAG
jgi:dipeptidyl aminopeptidase/acylaminoacyl peptidase